MKNIKLLECRTVPVKLTQYKIEIQGSSTTKSKKTKEYDYYLCDNCGERIIISKKWEQRTGGVIEVRTGYKNRLKLAVCNKCLNDVRKAINEAYNLNI